uniref:Streptomycin biosynthesis protein StrF domain-containing protein n=1 Tax=Eubacterium plexicaudatum ASF492 TaxID=1235802 RepID=N2AZZ7_9FIRM
MINKSNKDRKICFIMCTNDALYEKECVYYIKRLYVPQGYEVEVLSVKEARSMTEGYNQAMRQSDAKYKVYLHQDVFIIYEQFLTELLSIFQDAEIGMIGIVGSLNIEQSAVMWYSDRVGMLHANSVYKADSYLFGEVCGTYQEVSAVDGLLMATQYDIPWRDDLFKNWDFYDLSQSMEFRKKGYKVVVPFTEKPWCIHDDGILNLGNYYKERNVYLKEYGDQ